MERADRTERWIAWLVAGAVAVLSHPFGATVVAAELLVLVMWRRSLPDRALLGRVAIPAAIVVALAVWAAKFGADRVQWIQGPSVGSGIDVIRALAGTRDWIPLLAYGAAVAALVVVGIFLRPPRRELSWPMTITACWLAGPFLLALAISLLQPVFLGRYLIVALPPLVILVGAGIAQLRRIPAIAATAAIVVVSLPGAMTPIRDDAGENWRGAGALVVANARPGDIAIVTTPGRPTFSFYEREQASGRDAPMIFDLAEYQRSGSEAPACLPQRVWLVTYRSGGDERAAGRLRSTHELTRRWNLEGVNVRLFESENDDLSCRRPRRAQWSRRVSTR